MAFRLVPQAGATVKTVDFHNRDLVGGQCLGEAGSVGPGALHPTFSTWPSRYSQPSSCS